MLTTFLLPFLRMFNPNQTRDEVMERDILDVTDGTLGEKKIITQSKE